VTCAPLPRCLCVAVFGCLTSLGVCAHSASDAYLTLTLQKPGQSVQSAKTVVHGQWDIALRDLDFVLGLDDNGDGHIVWGELRRHQPQISEYAYRYIHASAAGKDCKIKPMRQMVDYHADGAYAALFFDVECDGAPKGFTIDYQLFFAIDPSHRGILVMHSGDNLATSVLSPENSKIDLDL
jgi:hypothetical protein